MSKKHAKYSASSSKRWINCPGSVALIEKCPPTPDSVYAIEGTQAHLIFEVILRNARHGLDRIENFLLTPGVKLLDIEKIDPEMVTHCKEAAQMVLDRAGPSSELFIEQKIDLSFVEPDTFGTGDVAILSGDTLTVLDLKYGAGLGVEVEEFDGSPNSQLAFYALGLLKKLEDRPGRAGMIKTVCLGVIQPRAWHEDGPLRTKTIGASDIWAFEDIFKAAIAKSKEPNAPLASGTWCQFCPATAICPEISKRALEKAKVVFKPDYSEMSFPAPESLTPETMGRALSVFPQLKFWMKEVEKRAMENLNLGEPVDGFKLVQKRGRRGWTDQESVLAKLIAEGRTDLIDTKPKSPAQIEKLAKDLKGFVKDNAVMFSSGVTLAPQKDKREAVRNQALTFDEWTEET